MLRFNQIYFNIKQSYLGLWMSTLDEKLKHNIWDGGQKLKTFKY